MRLSCANHALASAEMHASISVMISYHNLLLYMEKFGDLRGRGYAWHFVPVPQRMVPKNNEDGGKLCSWERIRQIYFYHKPEISMEVTHSRLLYIEFLSIYAINAKASRSKWLIQSDILGCIIDLTMFITSCSVKTNKILVGEKIILRFSRCVLFNKHVRRAYLMYEKAMMASGTMYCVIKIPIV